MNLNHKIENSKRKEHVYKLGDKIPLSEGTENKYEAVYQEPLIFL
jgi:hypothetical protein